MQRIFSIVAALALVVATGVASAQPVDVLVIFDETFDATPGTWLVTAQVIGNAGGTSGISGYAFDIVDIDVNDQAYQNDDAWTQDVNLGNAIFDGGVVPVGFGSPSQGIVGDSFYSVGSTQSLTDAFFAVGVSIVDQPAPPFLAPGQSIGVPAVLGIGNFPGTDFSNVEIGLYAPGDQPNEFLPAQDTNLSVDVVRIPEPASLALLGLGGLCLLARRR